MENKEPKFVSLVSDTTFKYLWKNEKTKGWFVDIIKNKTGMDLSDFELVDNEVNSGSSVKDQRNDLVLTDFKNEIVIIEMNSSYSISEERKYRYYLYRRAGNNYLTGKNYNEEKHTTLIAFNNYIKSEISDVKVLNSWFGVHDLNIKYNDIEMYEIYLPNFHKICYHECNEIDKRLWLFGAKDYQEMHENIKDDSNLYIVEELERLSMNDNFIDEYDYEIVQKKLANSYKIEGYEEGLSKGEALGEKNKQLEIAKKMLGKKSDIDFICECTGLSIDEVNDLKV